MKPLQKGTRASKIFAGVLALAVVWIGFQLATRGHTGILRTLLEVRSLLRHSTSATAQPRQVGAPLHTVNLSWKASPTPGVAYNLYRRGKGGVVTVNSAPITATSYVDNSVQRGETYYYVVKAVKGAESLPSNEVRVTIPWP